MGKMKFKIRNSKSHSHFEFVMINSQILNSKRSQSAVEFVILIAFVLFFFTAFSLVIQGNMSDRLRERKNIAIKEIALTVQDEINLAQESSEGYFRTFKLPKNLNGQEYSIELNESMVYIHTPDDKYAMALPIADLTVVNPIQKGFNNITKENGEVKLNP